MRSVSYEVIKRVPSNFIILGNIDGPYTKSSEPHAPILWTETGFGLGFTIQKKHKFCVKKSHEESCGVLSLDGQVGRSPPVFKLMQYERKTNKQKGTLNHPVAARMRNIYRLEIMTSKRCSNGNRVSVIMISTTQV